MTTSPASAAPLNFPLPVEPIPGSSSGFADTFEHLLASDAGAGIPAPAVLLPGDWLTQAFTASLARQSPVPAGTNAPAAPARAATPSAQPAEIAALAHVAAPAVAPRPEVAEAPNTIELLEPALESDADFDWDRAGTDPDTGEPSEPASEETVLNWAALLLPTAAVPPPRPAPEPERDFEIALAPGLPADTGGEASPWIKDEDRDDRDEMPVDPPPAGGDTNDARPTWHADLAAVPAPERAPQAGAEPPPAGNVPATPGSPPPDRAAAPPGSAPAPPDSALAPPDSALAPPDARPLEALNPEDLDTDAAVEIRLQPREPDRQPASAPGEQPRTAPATTRPAPAVDRTSGADAVGAHQQDAAAEATRPAPLRPAGPDRKDPAEPVVTRAEAPSPAAPAQDRREKPVFGDGPAGEQRAAAHEPILRGAISSDPQPTPAAHPKPAPAPERLAPAMEIAERPTPPLAPQTREILIDLRAATGEDVQLAVRDRGAGVQISLHSNDAAVREAIQSGVSDLAGNLEMAGYRIDAMTLERGRGTSMGSGGQPEASAQEEDPARQRPPGERGQHGQTGADADAASSGGRQGRRNWRQSIEEDLWQTL